MKLGLVDNASWSWARLANDSSSAPTILSDDLLAHRLVTPATVWQRPWRLGATSASFQVTAELLADDVVAARSLEIAVVLLPVWLPDEASCRPAKRYAAVVATYAIRQYGDPVLKQRTRDVEEIDGKVARLAEDMLETMYDAPGSGLAANQVGVQRRLFVYDVGEGARTVINPRIVESSGEWVYDEGCLSVPGLSWPIVRPNEVHLVGLDLDGNEISIEADTLEGRVLQHELDHLDGVLLVERLDPDQRREARRILRARSLGLPADDPDGLSSLAGPARR